MKITVVGIGPGNQQEITPRARRALEECRVVAGYTGYLAQVAELIDGKEVVATGMRGEEQRCRAAVDLALEGKPVCVVSGGDPAVYGMAGLVCQLAAEHPELEVEVVPGVTAATAASAVLGAPLGHDFAVISLSDLLTPWAVIQKRVELAAEGDFVLCFYNPGSKGRQGYLRRACELILEHRDPSTPCGLVRNAGREGEAARVLELAELRDTEPDMFTTALVGNSQTRVLGGRLVTPRGYLL